MTRAITGDPWTAEEVELLARAYAKGGIAAARAALPHRSIGALYHKTKRARLAQRRRRWTPKDDALLVKLWDRGEPLLRIARALGRTKVTIYWRASSKLGLTSRLPEGFEYLTQAEKRTGFPLKTLYAILAAAKVKIRRVPSRPEKKRGKYRGRRRSQRMVLITDVDAAVALRLKQETVHKQAHARGVAPETLARRLKALGVNRAGRKRRLMVTDEQVQRALAAKLVRTRAAHGHYTGARFVEATA